MWRLWLEKLTEQPDDARMKRSQVFTMIRDNGRPDVQTNKGQERNRDGGGSVLNEDV